MATSDMIYLGALTTTFTPPVSCYDLTVSSDSGTFWTTSRFTGTDGSSSSTSFTTVMTPLWYEKFDYALDPNCYPVADRAMRTEAYYSPGVCPEDWTTVQRRTNKGETTANCCPSGFTIDTSLCRSSIRVTTTEAILYYQDTRASSNPQEITVTANDIVWASGIEVRYKAGDFSTTSESSISSKTSASETTDAAEGGPTTGTGQEDTKGDVDPEAAGGGEGEAPPPDPQPTGSGSSGLSTGAKIGIGIGVPLAAIAAGALAFALWWRRRRGKAAGVDGNLQQPNAPLGGSYGGPQMVMAGTPGHGQPHYDVNGNQYIPVAQPLAGAYGEQAYGAKNPATDTVAPLGGFYKTPGSDADTRTSELYAPGAHGGYAQHQRPISEVPGSSPSQSYNGLSPGHGVSPGSGVSPSQSPQQVAAYPQPQSQPHIYEAPDNHFVPNSNAGPLPDHHELYPETVDDNRK